MDYEIIKKDHCIMLLNRKNNSEYRVNGYERDGSAAYINTSSGLKISISLVDFKEFHSLNHMINNYPEFRL